MNKMAANLLKKGVTAALNLLAKAVDGLFAGIQKLYKSIMAGIKKFLTLDFKKVFSVLLEAAQIAAEIALAFATGGGSVLLQIIKWLATTLPQLLRKVGAVMGFVNTIRSIKFQDIKQFLGAAGIAGFLVKGLFGELRGLPAEPKGKEEKEPGSGGAERGLMKVLHVLTGVFGVLKSVFDRIAGGLSRIVGIINISNKPWFAPFTAIYAGVVKAMELVPNPAEALNDGVDKLKEAAGEFFGSIKTKVKDIAGSIKEKVMLLGNPAQLMKLLANKAIDMVLNFIITNPPSALLKAVFKGIEAIAGKSLVELIRQYIPFADKLFDKIAASGPVQSIMKPLEGPVNSVGGMIEQVTDQATGVVDNAEQSAMSSMGNGSKLLSGFAGSSGSQSGQAGTAGTAGDGKGQEKKGGQSQGGGDFLSLLKSGVHTRLMTFGLMNIRKLGAKVIAAGAAKVTGVIKKMLTPKVKFKLGAEEHELWVEKGKNRNVVMMASKNPAPIKVKIQEGEMPNNGEVNDKYEGIESEKDDQKVVQQNEVLADTIQAVTAGVGEAKSDVIVETEEVEIGPTEIKIKRYGEWKDDGSGRQKHHLNQDAAFRKDQTGKQVIPTNEGYTIELEGNAFKDEGSPHFMAHKTMEEFWSRYRFGGDKFGKMPTNAEYNVALYKSLRKAGVIQEEATIICEKAKEQRLAYGLADDDFVPRVPGQINSLKKFLFKKIKLKKPNK